MHRGLPSLQRSQITSQTSRLDPISDLTTCCHHHFDIQGLQRSTIMTCIGLDRRRASREPIFTFHTRMHHYTQLTVQCFRQDDMHGMMHDYTKTTTDSCKPTEPTCCTTYVLLITLLITQLITTSRFSYLLIMNMNHQAWITRLNIEDYT